MRRTRPSADDQFMLAARTLGRDQNGFEVLARGECLDLLRPGGIGRIGVSVRALPVVLPMAFALVDDDIVFRTGEGTRLAQAATRAVVGFEADELDVTTGTGWSVSVTGTHLVRVRTELVSGRRL